MGEGSFAGETVDRGAGGIHSDEKALRNEGPQLGADILMIKLLHVKCPEGSELTAAATGS